MVMPEAVFMDGLGNDLLAGARCPTDKYCDITVGYRFSELDDLGHFFAAIDYITAKLSGSAAATGQPQDALDLLNQIILVNRFG